MPTITFSYSDFQQLLGMKIPLERFGELLLLHAKAELGKYDEATGEATVELDDTNVPYLWCVEGLARLMRNVLGKQTGPATINLKKGGYVLIAEESVRSVRPFIASFVAKGKPISDYFLKQLVQTQEKIDTGYGRKRQKISIGLYSYKRLVFPVHYRAVAPESVSFVPLGFERPANLSEILEQHPKGKEYGWILKGFARYPLLVDSKGTVLSFPPIINSNFTGKVETGDKEVLFEATGTDEESVNLTAGIFAQNLAERGFDIYSVTIKYPGTTITSPVTRNQKEKISAKAVEELTGLKLDESELKVLLRKAGYEAAGGYATPPAYRADIMHPVDVIEDIAIAYGFDRIQDAPLTSYTVGGRDKAATTINSIRKAVSGMGFQEIFSHILSGKSTLRTGIPGGGGGEAVHLQNFMSETYSTVRNSIIIQLLEVLSGNKHVDYPQKLFEEGIVAAAVKGRISEWRSLALVSAHSRADFTEMKQYLAALLAAAGRKFDITPAEHELFMKGRAAVISVNNKTVGMIGEVSPELLSSFGIEMPTVALEINVGETLIS